MSADIMDIHPTAIVSSDAVLGPGTRIGPFAVIESGVTVGEGCTIGAHACLMTGTRIGARCQIHPLAVLGDEPQDLAFSNEPSYVEIGDDCVIREGATVHRGTQPETTTRVGNGCMLMAYSHVGHNAQVGNRVIVANGALLAGYVEVGDGTFISGTCLIHQHTRIGRLAMLSGGAAVQRDVPPFCITQSMTANIVTGLNLIGLRRAGMPEAERKALERAFRTLYRSGLPLKAALARMVAEAETEAEQEMIEFIRSSKRGICRFVRDASPGSSARAA
jgi:UDP-N-acetylglucosamine acyltransferase